MTRNEALEKIKVYIYDNFEDVFDNGDDVANDLLGFFEDELGMKQVIIKSRYIEERPFKMYMGSIVSIVDFYVDWDKENETQD